MARFAVHEAALARRSMTGIGRKRSTPQGRLQACRNGGGAPGASPACGARRPSTLRACRRATCGRDGSGSASRCAFAAARPPLTRLAVLQAALARRTL